VPGFGNLAQRTLPGGEVVPRLVDPRALTVQGTAADVARIGSSLAGFGHTSDALAALAPGPGLLIESQTRRDPLTGATFPSSFTGLDIMEQEATQLPPLATMLRNIGRARELRTDPAKASRVLYPYSAAEPIGKFTFGTFPVSVNPAEARRRAASEITASAPRVKRETLRYAQYRKDLLGAAKTLKAGWGNKIPARVEESIRNKQLLAETDAGFRDQLDRPLTAKDQLTSVLNLAVRTGKMSESRARGILERHIDQDERVLQRLNERIRTHLFSTRRFNLVVDVFNRGLRLEGKTELAIS